MDQWSVTTRIGGGESVTGAASAHENVETATAAVRARMGRENLVVLIERHLQPD
jgi:hypothetical protein